MHSCTGIWLLCQLNILENVHLIKLGSHLLIGEKFKSSAMLIVAVGQRILVVPACQNTRERMFSGHPFTILHLLHMKQGTSVLNLSNR